jgi:hypothetical protein
MLIDTNWKPYCGWISGCSQDHQPLSFHIAMQAQASGSEEHSGKEAAPLLAAHAHAAALGAGTAADDVEDKLEERSTFNPRKMRPKRWVCSYPRMSTKLKGVLSSRL